MLSKSGTSKKHKYLERERKYKITRAENEIVLVEYFDGVFWFLHHRWRRSINGLFLMTSPPVLTHSQALWSIFKTHYVATNTNSMTW